MYTKEELETNKQCYEISAKNYIENSAQYEKNDKAVLGNFMYEMTYFISPKILVLGVGDCRVARKLKEVGHVDGIDFCSEFVKLASENGIDCIEGEFLTTNIKSKYNGIVCASFLHLFKEEDIDNVLQKIYMTLKPNNGIIFVGQPLFKENKGWVKEKKNSNSNQYRYHLVQTLDWWIDKLSSNGFANVSLVKTLDANNDNKIWFDSVWRKI